MAVDAGAPARAEAAARALDRAGDATAQALRHLQRAADVEWSGQGAAAYRVGLDDVTEAVRRTHRRLRRATAAMERHAVDAERQLVEGLTGSALADGALVDLAALGRLAELAAPAERLGSVRSGLRTWPDGGTPSPRGWP